MGAKRHTPIPDWVRLDNAAKIYPAARTRQWTAVFRLSVTLTEEVDPRLLQQALETTLERIPLFAYRLRRGVFWFFLDRQHRAPRIEPDVQNPCARMQLNGRDAFLFRLRYHDRRIAVEIFHSLADGTGGLTFLMTLTAEYLRLKYGKRIPEAPYVLDVRKPPKPEEWEDSFLIHAREGVRSRSEEKAYHLTGHPLGAGGIGLVTGMVDTAELKSLAHRCHATVNVLLASVLLKALLDVQAADKRKAQRKKPVKLSMPVNLRRYYPSGTLRNFSSYFNASINPTYGHYTLEDIVEQVRHFAALEGAEQMINARMSTNVAAEKNALLRAVPLLIKTPVLKMMYALTGERFFTTTLSNLGDLRLPEEMLRHVERADFILGPSKQNKTACGVISAGGLTSISFSRTVQESDTERAFFSSLVKMGLHVTVESNGR